MHGGQASSPEAERSGRADEQTRGAVGMVHTWRAYPSSGRNSDISASVLPSNSWPHRRRICAQRVWPWNRQGDGASCRGRGGSSRWPALGDDGVGLDAVMELILEPEDRLFDEVPGQARHDDADRQLENRAEQGAGGVEAVAAPQLSEHRLD